MAETPPPSSMRAAPSAIVSSSRRVLSSSPWIAAAAVDSVEAVNESSSNRSKRRKLLKQSNITSFCRRRRNNDDDNDGGESGSHNNNSPAMMMGNHHHISSGATTTTTTMMTMERFLREEKPNMTNHSAVKRSLWKLEDAGFFEDKDHERAKRLFSEVMEHFDLTVDYATAERFDKNDDKDDSASGRRRQLDPSIFRLCVTYGVERDIPAAAEDPVGRVHVFSVASQYNCAEAPSPFTPGVGKAMRMSEYDRTQGPLAQRTNPVLFECVTAFLTHCGYNMMERVLPSAGKTWNSPRRAAIAHGYLRPTNRDLDQLTQEMKENYAKYEAPCYQTRLLFRDDGEEEGSAPSLVYLMLGAAPAIGYSSGLTKDSRELQYYAHLANFAAMFGQLQTLLGRFPDKEVVLHVTGIGLGVFGCDARTFAEAFAEVGSRFQESLCARDKKRARIQLESFGRAGELSFVAKRLHLEPEKPRLE